MSFRPLEQPFTRLALSHADYSRACSELRTPRPLNVQVMLGGLVLCGQVRELYRVREAGECFKVATAIGPVNVTARNVRLCSGDGHCACEGQA